MKRILVADDSVTIQKVITLTFADEPFEVQSVGTGAEALELVKSWNPDIVLADVIMPQMNGYELCRAVKQQEETSATPVLLLAGTFEAFDEAEAKSVGADDFITKPFESGELIEKVKKLIGSDQGPSEVEAAQESPGVTAITEDQPQPVPTPQTSEPVPASAAEITEPDIWDILSDSGTQPQPQTDGSGAHAPGFGPIEDAGVVDVGSFDVGIGRPESPPVSQPPEPVVKEATEATEVIQMPEEQPSMPSDAPVTGLPIEGVEERSQVEDREKDFFGFETGAVEEVPDTDFLEDAVEEVTFEMEQPQSSPETAPRESTFIVPEPAEEREFGIGETAPTGFPTPDLSPLSDAPQAAAGSFDENTEEVPSPPPAPSFAEAPPAVKTEVEGMEIGPITGSETLPTPEPVTTPDTEQAVAPATETEVIPSPAPEAPLELPVELTHELSEGFSPELTVEPTEQISEPTSPGPAADGPETPSQDQPGIETSPETAGVSDDAAIRKIIEEKVEKVAWEVIPEMAETMIREAIQKIKEGS